jgi:hypothetical protein
MALPQYWQKEAWDGFDPPHCVQNRAAIPPF